MALLLTTLLSRIRWPHPCWPQSRVSHHCNRHTLYTTVMLKDRTFHTFVTQINCNSGKVHVLKTPFVEPDPRHTLGKQASKQSYIAYYTHAQDVLSSASSTISYLCGEQHASQWLWAWRTEIWQMEAENRAKILLFRSRPPQRITQGKITAAPEAVGAAACVRVWGLGRQQNIQASSTSHCFDCGGWSYRWGGNAAEGRVTDGVSDLSDVIRWENQPWMWNRVDRHLSGWQQSVQLITSFRFQQIPSL